MKGIPMYLPTARDRAIVAHALQVLAVDVDRGLACVADAEEIRNLRLLVIAEADGCEHPGLLPSMDAPHPTREPLAYEAWLNRKKPCTECGARVPERDL